MERPRSRLPALTWASGLALLLLTISSLAEEPESLFSKCGALVRDEPQNNWSYECYVRVARWTGRWDDAARHLTALSETGPDREWAMHFLAVLEGERGDDARAERLFRDAAARLAEARRWRSEGHQRLGFVFFLLMRGRLAEAERQVASAARAAERTSDRDLGARVAISEARVANRQGDHGRAWRTLATIESDLFPDGPAYTRATWHNTMGTVCWAIGRHEQAYHQFHQEAALWEAMNDRGNASVALNNLVLVAPLVGLEPGELEALARRALAAAEAAGSRKAQSVAHSQLSSLTRGAERVRHAEKALALWRDRLSLDRAALAVVEEEPERAYRYAEEAAELARRTGDLAEIARNAVARARLRWRTGPRGEAIADSLAALDAIEETRSLQPEGNVRARRFGEWGNPYDGLVGHLLSGDLLGAGERPGARDLELALSVMERRRARVLLEELDATRRDEARESLDEASRQIAGVQRRLLDPRLSEVERAEALVELDRLELDEAELRAGLARRARRRSGESRSAFADLAEVRAALAPDQAVLSFWIADEQHGGSWLLVVTGAGIRPYRLPDRQDLWTAVSLLRGLLRRRDGSLEAGTVGLYRDLLQAALAGLPAEIRRLVIVADQPLHQLPFAVLRPSRHEPPLVATFEISVAPSATAWLRWSARRPEPRSLAFALADPELPFAGRGSGTTLRGWVSVPELDLGPLPYARREARRVLRELGGGRLLVGEEASEHLLKRVDLRSFGVLHVAAHAVADNERPERSAVLLAPGAEEEDGLLQLREVRELDLSGQLVVLSACQSAGGLELSGEGVLGLAGAFLVAGAQAVVGSVWALDDREAAAFFVSFYRRLAGGESVASALAATQREGIRDGDPAEAWAGVLVMGDGDLVPVPGGRRRVHWGLAAGSGLLVIVASALAFTFARRRRRREALEVGSAGSV